MILLKKYSCLLEIKFQNQQRTLPCYENFWLQKMIINSNPFSVTRQKIIDNYDDTAKCCHWFPAEASPPICHWVITISSCKLPTQRRFKIQLSTHWGFKQFEPFHSRLIPFIVSLHPVSQGLWQGLAYWSSSQTYGISGPVFGLISSFLSHRCLLVVLDGKPSQEYPE